MIVASFSGRSQRPLTGVRLRSRRACSSYTRRLIVTAEAQKVNRGTGILAWGGKVVPQSLLVSTAKTLWRLAWTLLVTELAPQAPDGSYIRPPSSIIGLGITPTAPTAYLGNTCPWCHRVALVAALRDLPPSALTIVPLGNDAERASRGGWVFEPWAPDPLVAGARDLRETYDALVPGGYSGRCTAPLLAEGPSAPAPGSAAPGARALGARGPPRAVSNDSAEICRLLNAVGGGAVDLRPAELVSEIDELCREITADINDAVYASGFATTQGAYDRVQGRLWGQMERMDARLAERRFLHGDRVTLSDVFLFPTIVRFDAIYGPLFRCSSRRVADFPSIQRWLRDVYALPRVAATIDLEDARESYYRQLFPLNASGIVQRGPTAQQQGLRAAPPAPQGPSDGGGASSSTLPVDRSAENN